MKITSLALSGAALGLASANSVAKRALTDADILNYALTLEHLEAAFYEEGLKNYTEKDFMDAGLDGTFYTNLKMIASDEKTHEEFLTQALTAAGAQPVEACKYSFPATDVKTFLSLGNVLEGVGVSAYLGAAASIMNDTYLTAAGSILTVEARHSAYLRAALGEAPSAQAFDNPLDLDEVYTVAAPFIASCPSSNGKLPVKSFPSLSTSSMAPVMTGDQIKLMVGSGFDTSMDMSDIHAAFITVTGPVWATVKSDGNEKCTVTVPKGVAGQSYVVLTKGNTQATDDSIVAGPAIIEVGAMTGKMGMGAGDCGKKSAMPTGTMPMSMPTATPSMTGSMSMSMSGSMSSGMATASATPSYNAASGNKLGGASLILGVVLAAALAAVH